MKRTLAGILAVLTALACPQRAWGADHLVSANDIELRLAGAAQEQATALGALQQRVAKLRAQGALSEREAADATARLAALNADELRDLATRTAALDADPAAAGVARVAGISLLVFLGLVVFVAAICLLDSSTPGCTR